MFAEEVDIPRLYSDLDGTRYYSFWRMLRSRYVAGNMSLEVLARKYDVPLSTLKYHSAREQWYPARLRYREQMSEYTVKKDQFIEAFDTMVNTLRAAISEL
jgi:hypothetical protein